ncbi:hypothetical protein Bbelb_307690 [Branchiostoma belcheri]|nr:hypothetical protein Bbelb_307690 [Branchiostoma belcheri]
MGKEHMCRKTMVYVRTRVRAPQFKEARWYALDVGQGELTFAQLYEGLVAASEFRPYNISSKFCQDQLHYTAKIFFCNDEKFGCFIRMVIDKTAATTEAVPRPKTAFECSDMHFTSSTVLLFSQTEVRVMKTMLPLVCWNCGEEETLPIPTEKTAAYRSINPVCQACKNVTGRQLLFQLIYYCFDDE